MADTKISALTGATTPLAGTEVVPVVQGGQTRKVAIDDFTVKNVRSNASTGLLQITGPATGTTHVMTTPNANFTAARTDAAQSFSGTQTISDILVTAPLIVSLTGDNQQVATTKSFVLLSGNGAARSGCFLQAGTASGQVLRIRGATWAVTVINNPSGTQNAYFNLSATSATFGNGSGQVLAMDLIFDASYGPNGSWFELGRSVA